MRLTIILSISLIRILIPCKAISQNGIEEKLFNETFPELPSIFSDSTEDYMNMEKIKELRVLYEKMQNALRDLEHFRYTGDYKNAWVFEYKNLKKVRKELDIKKLENLIITQKKKVRSYILYQKDVPPHDEIKSNIAAFIRANKIDDAYHYWNFLFHNYPHATKIIYTRGASILEYKFEQTNDLRWIDTLMMLYDQRIKYKFFGKRGQYPEGYILGRKAICMLKYTPKNIDSVYSTFQKSVKLQGEESEDAILIGYMVATEGMFVLDKINAAEVIDNYLSITAIIEELLKEPTNTYASEALKEVKRIFERCKISIPEPLNKK